MAAKVYTDATGKRLPSVTTIIGRFKDSGALLYWANEQGRNGLTLDEARIPAASAGTLAHAMVESHLRGETWKAPEGTDAEILGKADAAFAVFLEWASTTKIEFVHTEVSLASATHRFGGTLDAIGMLNGKRILIDFKTSNALYADYLYQIAAYGLLWTENYPEHPIDGGYHLARFAKDQGDFTHSFFPSVDEEAATFIAMRTLYDRVKKTEKRVR